MPSKRYIWFAIKNDLNVFVSYKALGSELYYCPLSGSTHFNKYTYLQGRLRLLCVYHSCYTCVTYVVYFVFRIYRYKIYWCTRSTSCEESETLNCILKSMQSTVHVLPYTLGTKVLHVITLFLQIALVHHFKHLCIWSTDSLSTSL